LLPIARGPIRPDTHAAGFKAGSRIGHCLINRTSRDAVYLEVGTRAASERVYYSDVDMIMERDASGRRYRTRSGAPIEHEQRESERIEVID
jgi:uncharacterized cupin superfamily protein